MEAVQRLSFEVLTTRQTFQRLLGLPDTAAERLLKDRSAFSFAAKCWAELDAETQLKVRAIIAVHDEYTRRYRALPWIAIFTRDYFSLGIYLAWEAYSYKPVRRIINAEDKAARKAWDMAVKLDPSFAKSANVNATNIDESRFIPADPERLPPRHRLV
jgi:hypothetical protein